jgi:hypothetical protein
MTSQLNYLIAQQRQAELVSCAERAVLASDAHLVRSASPSRWNVGRPLSTRRLKAPHMSAAARKAHARAPRECVSCDL